MAEVYWDLEWTLQQQGFDYTYDKRLYDRLRDGHARPVREHLYAGLDFQDKMARFLENHDEPRAAATFLAGSSRSCRRHHVSFARPAILPPRTVRGTKETDFASPWSRSGRTGRRASCRSFTTGCLPCCVNQSVRDGRGNWSNAFPRGKGIGLGIALLPSPGAAPDGERLLAAVNYAPNQSQCYVRLPFTDLACGKWRLQDQLGTTVYDREGDDLQARGLYLDAVPWQASIFSLQKA